MSKCKFTIITVCFNAEEYIEDTIQSVLSQTYNDYEYIIKDGQSHDETMDIVHRLTDNNNRVIIIQGKDRGIYDAMNIAVSSAEGDYVLFLNAGDRFADENVLRKTAGVMEANEADILYGDVIEISKTGSFLRKYTGKNCKMWYYALGACLCHQAMFCKKELFQKKLFDLNYAVCADREWQMCHIKKGAVANAMGFAIAEVMTDGFSKEHVEELEEEVRRCVKKYCGAWYFMYRMICFCKKNRFLYHIIQKTEQIISCK